MSTTHDDWLAVVDAGRGAPSGDNLQPFRYHLYHTADGPCLDVDFDAARAAHVLDAAGHASRLTLGMVLASMRLVAGQRGLAVHATLHEAAEALDGPARGDRCWATLRLRRAPDRAEALASALGRRHTDRRLYDGRPDAGGEAAALLALCCAQAAEAAARYGADDAIAAAVGRVSVGACAPTAAGPRRWLEAADRALWDAPAIPHDALRWVRFDHDALRRDGEGVSFRNLGLPLPLAAGAAVARAWPGSLRLGARLGGPALTGRLLRAQLGSSRAIVTIATADALPHTLVAAGEVALRVWVHLCAGGWSAQPLTLAPILTMSARDGALHPALPSPLGERALQGWIASRAALALPLTTWPAFVLRAGPNAPLPAALRPPRRPRSAVLRDAWAGSPAGARGATV